MKSCPSIRIHKNSLRNAIGGILFMTSVFKVTLGMMCMVANEFYLGWWTKRSIRGDRESLNYSDCIRKVQKPSKLLYVRFMEMTTSSQLTIQAVLMKPVLFMEGSVHSRTAIFKRRRDVNHHWDVMPLYLQDPTAK